MGSKTISDVDKFKEEKKNRRQKAIRRLLLQKAKYCAKKLQGNVIN